MDSLQDKLRKIANQIDNNAALNQADIAETIEMLKNFPTQKENIKTTGEKKTINCNGYICPIFQAVPLGYLLLNEDCTIVEHNNYSFKNLSYSTDLLKGKNFTDFLDDSSKKNFETFWQTITNSCLDIFSETSVKLKNSEIQQSYIYGHSYYSQEGKIKFVNLFFIPNHHYRNEISSLKEISSKYFSILEHIKKGLLITDNTGRIIEWSNETARLFEVPATQMSERFIWTFLYNILPREERTDEFYKKLRDNFTKFYKTGELHELSVPVEYKAFTKSGKRKYIYTYFFPIVTPQGYSLGAIFQDITETKQTTEEFREKEEKLTILNEQKDKFYSILAHDLKNPFNNIIGLSELLVNRFDKLEKDKIIKFLRYIYQSSEQGYNLLENLLKWSRSQRGILVWNPKKISITNIMHDTEMFLQSLAKHKNIELINQIQDELYAYGDANMVLTVLRNLISNSIKFTHPEGKITIYSRKKEAFLEIIVEDTGVGIPEDRIKNLFSMSHITSTQGTKNETGTGLGLTLCKEFVEKNGGEIRVESTVDVGSKFIFTIPFYGNE